MKFNPQEIRAAIDSRLSNIQASGARRARIREAIRKEGEPRRRRRLTVAAAAASLAVVIIAGVLLAAGLNLFALGGTNDVRMTQNTPQAVLSGQWAAVAGTGADETTAYITDTYYNGSTLQISYTIEGGTQFEPFTPTNEQLAEMKKIKGEIPNNLYINANQPLMQEFASAMESGTPFGVTDISVWPDNRMWLDDGTEFGHADSTQSEIIDGAGQAVRQYDSLGLDSEELRLSIPLWQSESALYFDGTDLYVMNGVPQSAGTMTATALRTDEPIDTVYAVDDAVFTLLTQGDSQMETVRMTGQSSYNGVTVNAELLVTPEASVLMLVPETQGFAAPTAAYWAEVTQDSEWVTRPDPIGDYWYSVFLSDAGGNTLYTVNVSLSDTGVISELFERLDDLPKAVTATLMLHNWESGTIVMNPITLTRVKEASDGDVFSLAEQAAQYKGSAYITSASFDSGLLQLSCVIGEAQRFETFDPTPDQLQSMELVRNMDPGATESWPDDAVVRQYLNAVESGTPGGFVSYSVVLDQRTITDAGITLAQADQTHGEFVDGSLYIMREYNNPQIDSDKLTVEIPLQLNATYLYFDGTDHYMANPARQEIGVMSAEVWRRDALKRHMTGTGAYLGAPVSAEASVSAGYCELTLTVSGGELPETNGTTQYDVVVRDGDGNELLMDTYSLLDAHTIAASFYGMGELPDTLTAEVLLLNGAAAATLIPPVTLTPEEEPVLAASWEELNAAALAGASLVNITANITFGENDDTIVFHNAVTLQGDGMHFNIDGGGKQILCVQGADKDTPLTDETVIRNLVFMNGRNQDESGDVYQAGYGGAVFVQGPLVMESCAFLYSASDYGALCVADGDAVLTDCWWTNNSASGLCILNGSAAIANCKFAECHAQNGGGVYGENANITITGSRILSCVSEVSGGGIYLSGGELFLSECTIEGNITEGSGGAIYLENGTLTLDDQTVISGNTPDDIVQP